MADTRHRIGGWMRRGQRRCRRGRGAADGGVSRGGAAGADAGPGQRQAGRRRLLQPVSRLAASSPRRGGPACRARRVHAGSERRAAAVLQRRIRFTLGRRDKRPERAGHEGKVRNRNGGLRRRRNGRTDIPQARGAALSRMNCETHAARTTMPIRTTLTLTLAAAFIGGCALEVQNRQPAQELAQAAAAGLGLHRLARLPGTLRRLPRGEAATGTDKAPNLLERVQTLGPRSFVGRVLYRYDWGIPAQAGSERGARGAGRGDPAAPPGRHPDAGLAGRAARAGAHRRPMPGCRRAQGTQGLGPADALSAPAARLPPQAPGACGMGALRDTALHHLGRHAGAAGEVCGPRCRWSRSGPRGCPTSPAAATAHQGRRLAERVSPARTKCTAELRLNDISSSEMRHWKTTNSRPPRRSSSSSCALLRFSMPFDGHGLKSFVVLVVGEGRQPR